MTSDRENIPLEHLLLDKNLYRKITKVAYSENRPIERIVNDMLTEYVNEVIALLNKNRNLEDYLDFLKVYAAASGYQIDISTTESGRNKVILSLNLGRKYSLYLGECFKILLAEVSQIDNYDFTDSLVFFECTPNT